MAEAKILNLDDFRPNTFAGPNGLDPKTQVRVTAALESKAQVLVTNELADIANKPKITLEDLYSADVPDTGLMMRARQLLHIVDQHAGEAHEKLKSGDKIGSDQEIMLLQADLQELFCCRSVSDGMGAFVLALHYALLNQRGVPLNLDQVFAVRKALVYLHNNLFVGLSETVDLIDSLVDCGMIVDPPEATDLTDVFASDPANQGTG